MIRKRFLAEASHNHRHIKMKIEADLIEVSVYHYNPVKKNYYVKVSFIGTGMYINSFSVSQSKFDSKPWWVQPPKHFQGNRWVTTVDFDMNYDLWKIIETKAIDAVDNFNNETPIITKSRDTVLEDIDDGPIDLSDIPF